MRDTPFDSPIGSTQSPLPINTGMDEQEKRELRIIKQAILKSAIEGGLIKLVPTQEEAIKEVSFLKKWVKWCYREDEQLTK